ncbi:MAG: 23S rRNA (uridine(2552)-2'-O)-methyltransferase RlmE [Alcanivoracaceae bacterium]|nr:23S rRNA (uridine(2552)-2'-O)-methyltransferase RlmE [Alcanivoracaceae bacterium]
MARSKSSQRWLKEHFDDHWVARAKAEGYRSRASFKLLEINEKDKLLRPGMRVLDLGAAPGGWSQVASRLIGSRGQIVASDILAMEAIPDVTFLQGDFREDSVFQELLNILDGGKVDLVLSDMAPNMSGNRSVDVPKAMYLAELALDMAQKVLEPDGRFLVKAFQGEGYDQYRRDFQAVFSKMTTRKPEASRPRSNEVYLLGSGLKMV